MASGDDTFDRRGRASNCLSILSSSAQRRIEDFLSDFLFKLGLLLAFVAALDLSLILDLNNLEHLVILLHILKLLLQFHILVVLEFGHVMVCDFLLFFLDLFFKIIVTALHRLNCVLLSINFPLPIALLGLELSLFLSQLLLEELELLP